MTKKRIVSQTSYVDSKKDGKTASSGTERVYLGTFEAQWTCTSCGTAGIPGRQKRCPNCGNPKGDDEVYEAPAGAIKYLTSKELKGMGVDPTQHLSDEKCDYCNAKLQPGVQKCPNCGAALGGVGYTTRQCPACSRESNEEKCPSCGSPTEEKLVAHREATPPAPTKPAAPAPFYKRREFIIPTVIVLLLLCLVTCLTLCVARTRNETATISALSWERTIAIEEHQYNRREDWNPPAGADIKSREERISGYDQVRVGTKEECGYEEECESESVYDHTEKTCYDDGTCDEHDVYRTEQKCHDEYVCEDVPEYESVPRYETWYVYQVWEWVKVDEEVARGTDNAPVWPEVALGDDQREGERSEHCEVIFTTDKGDSYPYTLSCSEIRQFKRGAQWQIKHDANRVLEVGPGE